MNKLAIIVLIAAAAVESVVCMMDKEKMMEVGKKCKEETNPSDDDIKNIMNKEPITTPEAKCMMACIFKTLGLMTADGKLDMDANLKAADAHLGETPEKLEHAKQLAEMCKDRVNAVKDDEKGCLRAAEMRACAIEKATEFGFKLD